MHVPCPGVNIESQLVHGSHLNSFSNGYKYTVIARTAGSYYAGAPRTAAARVSPHHLRRGATLLGPVARRPRPPPAVDERRITSIPGRVVRTGCGSGVARVRYTVVYYTIHCVSLRLAR